MFCGRITVLRRVLGTQWRHISANFDALETIPMVAIKIRNRRRKARFVAH